MYQALYRQWRPAGFKEMVGQEAVVKTLRNQIMAGRIAHAYLFCGSRGTGKTSTAKIMARAVNCLNPQEGDPCGLCEACMALAGEDNLDILEIDAASNNGVDEIRDLRDKVKYPPQYGRYKVYIIDEVHMLSAAAFNALLKTLEEPPAHVVFILATTEPQKLPA
ncbi:MAG: DNA polymerase III subunit gamma/tau, partial [Clostridia bacterium]|nr:DNA polymerase III subunit gamma/tau [Clostridia bacterium]